MNRIACVGAIAALSGMASADVVTMHFTEVGAGKMLQITVNGQQQTQFAGQLGHDITSGTGVASNLVGSHLTYCLDVEEQVATESGVEFSVEELEVLPETLNGGAGMGAAKAAALESVFATWADFAVSTTDAQFAAAFQLVIWEIVADFDPNAGNGGLDSLDLASGSFSALGPTFQPLSDGFMADFDAIAASLINGDSFSRVVGLANAGAQDQLLIARGVIPTPGTVAIAGLGLMCSARRRRG